jgi:hypothetical protein
MTTRLLTGWNYSIPNITHFAYSKYLDKEIELTYNIHQSPKVEETPVQSKVQEDKFEDFIA